MVDIFIAILLILLFVTTILFLGLELSIRFNILSNFPVPDTLIISCGFGFGFLALLVFSLGILHLLNLYVIIAVVLPFVLLNFSKKINFLKSIKSKNYLITFKGQNSIYKILILFLLFYVLINFLRALAPVIDHDSIEAYLYIPRLFVESHSITRLSFTMWDDLPLNVQMITTLALLIRDGIFAQVITGWLFGVLAMLAIYIIGKQLVNVKTGIIAAILFYTIPEVLWLSCTTKIDLGWAFWEYLALYLFMYWLKSYKSYSDNKILYLTFLFLGFSLGTKYITFISLIFFSLILTFILVKIKNVSLMKTVGILFKVNLVALIIAMPYFVKNTVYTHNPIFPYLFTENLSYNYSIRSYNGLSGLLNYFWNLFFERDFLFKPMYYKGALSFGFIIIAFLPSFLLIKKYRITFSYFILIWFSYSILMVFSSAPQPRHLLNSIPLLIIPASAGISYIFTQKNISKFLYFVIFLSFIFLNLRVKVKYFIKNESSVVFGKESKEDYLERVLFSLPKHYDKKMMSFIKNNLDANSMILNLYCCQAYYVDYKMTSDANLEQKFIFHEENTEKFLEKLMKIGITHIYLSDSDFSAIGELWKRNFAETIILNDDFKNTYLVPLFSSGDQHLFLVQYQTIK